MTKQRAMRHSSMTQELALKLWIYNPETGSFRWREYGPKRCTWLEAGSIDSGNYRIVHYGPRGDSHAFFVQDLIWLMVHGKWPDNSLDHKNGNGLDNRLDNLRPATMAQNNMNKARSSANTSGFKGVIWNKQRGKWMARIKLNGRMKYLGLFDNPALAHIVYQQAAQEHFGEFANPGDHNA